MAFSNTFDTTNPGSAVGNREDLSDVVSMLAPEITPVWSLAPKKKAIATQFDWVVDDLAAVDTTGRAEGNDYSNFDDEFAGQARLSNNIVEIGKAFMVSKRQQAVSSVGPAAYARAEMKAAKEVRRNAEAILCGTQDKATEDGAGTVSMTRGFGDWIDSTGPSDVPAAYRTPADSIHASGSFTETVFNNLITSIFRQTGTTQDLTLVADTALRRTITDKFARVVAGTAGDAVFRQLTQSGTTMEIVLGVEIYRADHGKVSIVNMNPDCAPDTTNKDTGYLINPEYYAVAELIPLGSSRLPDNGGGERGYVDYTFGLEMSHPGAHGKITVLQ